MGMRTYDLAFSLGFSCACTQSLREAGLQFASYPFDWVGTPCLQASVHMLETDFSGWMDKDDLELYDIRRAPLFSKVYRNARTGFGFPHDFPYSRAFEEAYPSVRERYDRRIRRLTDMIASSRKVLAVYVESVISRRLKDDELMAVQRGLGARFPGVTVDLLYFFHEDGCVAPRETRVGEGVMAVGLAYKRVEFGEVVHEINRGPVVAYLRECVTVGDLRSESDRAAYQVRHRRQRENRWGDAGPVRRLFNKFVYRLYRRLERRLESVGTIPRERPLWF